MRSKSKKVVNHDCKDKYFNPDLETEREKDCVEDRSVSWTTDRGVHVFVVTRQVSKERKEGFGILIPRRGERDR